MAWSTPLTVATDDLLSAAEYNQYIRDNLMETAPAKASSPGNIFTTVGRNQIVERVMASADIPTLESTASSSYGDLDTPGPTISLACRAAVILFSARMRNTNSASGKGAYVSVDVTGAKLQPATDEWAISTSGLGSSNPVRLSGMFPFNGDSNADNRFTFTLKYRCQTGYPSAQFDMRNITVFPL